MEYRKLQKTGGASYIISLPKEWIKKNGLKEGDTLYVKTGEGEELIVTPRIGEEMYLKEITLNVDEKESSEHIIRRLIALYLSGYTIIRVKTPGIIEENVRTAAERFSALVIGVEILEESINTIILQDLSNTMDLPMNKALNRMYLMTENMINDSRSCFIEFNELLANEIVKRDAQIDRIYWLITKQHHMILHFPEFARKLEIDAIKASNIRSVAKSLERIGDHLENIVSILLSEKKLSFTREQIEEMKRLFDRTVEILKNSFNSYTTKNGKLANEVIDMAELFASDAEGKMHYFEKKRDRNFVYLSLITESLVRICMYSADIGEIAINEDVKIESPGSRS